MSIQKKSLTICVTWIRCKSFVFLSFIILNVKLFAVVTTSRPITCNPGQFRCMSGEGCISDTLVCNGNWDCLDGSDESDNNCLGNVQQICSNDFAQRYNKATFFQK